MKTTSINAKVFLNASPKDVYELLMDEDKHGQITEGDAKISKKLDGRFELFGGYCHGYNIELVEGRKIVQAWFFDEDEWPRNHYSICTFEFLPSEGGCILNFDQSEIPLGSENKLKSGWQMYYWEPLQQWFSGGGETLI